MGLLNSIERYASISKVRGQPFHIVMYWTGFRRWQECDFHLYEFFRNSLNHPYA